MVKFGVKQPDRHIHVARPEVLPQALCLWIGPGGGGDARAEEADDDEIDGEQVGQFVAPDLKVRSLGKQDAEAFDREVVTQP
jgi:hypothetical protein